MGGGVGGVGESAGWREGAGRGRDGSILPSLKIAKIIGLARQEGRECGRQIGELHIRGQIKGK